MGRVLLWCLVTFVSFSTFGLDADAGNKKKELVIVFSADTVGFVEPCG